MEYALNFQGILDMAQHGLKPAQYSEARRRTLGLRFVSTWILAYIGSIVKHLHSLATLATRLWEPETDPADWLQKSDTQMLKPETS